MTPIQSQDIEKQRHATQGGPHPNQGQTPPQDRPPGQPHDPTPQTGQDDEVQRQPTQDSRRGSHQEPKRRGDPGQSG